MVGHRRHLSLLILMVLVMATPSPLGQATSGSTPTQFELVQWAENRFSAAGLVVPQVVIEFHDQMEDCGNHAGIFYRESHSIRMCSMHKDVMLHELAHAWAEVNLSSLDRAHLVAPRPSDLGEPRLRVERAGNRARRRDHQVGALGEEPVGPLYRPTSGQVGFRLLTIDQSAPEQLLRDFRLMTGRDPVFRNVSEWADPEALPEVFSPEA